jgi:hypothetical protein
MGNKKIISAIIPAIVIMVSTLILGLREEPVDIDSFPEEATILNSSKHANIVGKTSDLVEKLGGVVQYDLLSEDIYYFGKVTYEDYRKGIKKVIGFNIRNEVKVKDNFLTFKGNYGSSNNEVEISVELLKNKRIKTKIKDTKTNKTLDSDLPSSSDFNKLIANLPINNKKYTVEYSSRKDDIVIQQIEREPGVASEALGYLRTFVDDGTFDEKRIDIIFPPNTVGF